MRHPEQDVPAHWRRGAARFAVHIHADVSAVFVLVSLLAPASYYPRPACGDGGVCHAPEEVRKRIAFTAGLITEVSNGADPFLISRVPYFPMLCQLRVKYHWQKVFSVVAMTTKYSGSVAEIVKLGEDACRIVFVLAGRGEHGIPATRVAAGPAGQGLR